MTFEEWLKQLTSKQVFAADRADVPTELNLFDWDQSKGKKWEYRWGKVTAALMKIREDRNYLLKFDYIRRGDFIGEVKHSPTLRAHMKAFELNEVYHELVQYDQWLIAQAGVIGLELP